jgi:hypothetical protein
VTASAFFPLDHREWASLSRTSRRVATQKKSRTPERRGWRYFTVSPRALVNGGKTFSLT